MIEQSAQAHQTLVCEPQYEEMVSTHYHLSHETTGILMTVMDAQTPALSKMDGLALEGTMIILIHAPLFEATAIKWVLRPEMTEIQYLMTDEPLIELKSIAFGHAPLVLALVHHLYVSLYAEMVVMQMQEMNHEMMGTLMTMMDVRAPVQ